MARAGGGSPGTLPTLPRRHNVRLDSFLKRNTERGLYERIQGCEPCVVKSGSINKVYMHVVMSDERVYLTEFPPRTLTPVFSFSSVRAIELINDLPGFLSEKDRERCQHIKIIYVPETPASKDHSRLQRNNHLFPELPASHSASPLLFEGSAAHRSSRQTSRPTRSASCPNGETLGLLVPQPPARPHSSASMYPLSPNKHTTDAPSPKVPRRIGLLFSRLLNRDKETNVAELHLYALSPSSTLFPHLQSMWTSFNIKSTLMLDPQNRRRYCTSTSNSSGDYGKVISREQTSHLFCQLKTELLQEGVGVETLYLLLQELCSAAHRNTALRRLFWRSRELCLSLVQTLEDCLGGDQSEIYTADRLLMRTLIVQTFAVMLRETEVEPARLNLLTADNGAFVTRMLLALPCETETSNAPQLGVFLSEYLDAACSLLFELILLGHEKSGFSLSGCVLSVGWMLQVLQPHPHLLSFIGYQAQQVVLVLSGPDHILSPVQSVLLLHRCRLLLACLQYSSYVTQHLKADFREDFKYSINVLSAQMKLPPHYPISTMIRRLLEQIRTLILL